MPSKMPSKAILFPAANILFAVFLLWAFFTIDQNIIETFSVAEMSSLSALKPNSMNYFWDLNMHDAPVNKSWVRFYIDFYEQLLKSFPSLRDAYGVLGYCYHCLGDDKKAIDYFQKAIAANPLYTWNYYDLAAIYTAQGRYRQAEEYFKKMQSLNPQKSLERLYSSQYIYLPLLNAGGKNAIAETARHLQMSYKVSFDLIQLMEQMPYNKNMEKIIKQIKLQAYAF